jgi:hypothetical protein
LARRSGGPEEALIWSEAPPFFEAPPLSEGRGGGSGAWAGRVAVAGRQVAASGSFLGARCGEEKARARADTKQLCSSLIFKKNHATAVPVLASRLAYVLTPTSIIGPHAALHQYQHHPPRLSRWPFALFVPCSSQCARAHSNATEGVAVPVVVPTAEVMSCCNESLWILPSRPAVARSNVMFGS